MCVGIKHEMYTISILTCVTITKHLDKIIPGQVAQIANGLELLVERVITDSHVLGVPNDINNL